MSDVIAAFLVVIGFEEPEILPHRFHPPKPDPAWSSDVLVFRIGPRRWNELQSMRRYISHLLPRLVSRQKCSLARSKAA
ncbi:MAG: hypothetical protein EOS58_27780 [Mesorhizobium sp.]|nr:hypothetical protein EJ072_06305 [Mesorhizobium sp. M2A.F.Ca.ET.046.03.2.1]AZO71568.1 hypothetical protein EJ067_10685 [Mesorhizobium sp. M1D.F.Ca.ET.043.01.1.1]RVC81688.1 hypothetical protein EN766_02730 [Mesorhizobium sp. M2A.F.Ca.ET.046.02.1.1]RWB49855.1 MAG: hypothetical protein EOQ44_01785 [Mesorhizobium sp.]RWD00904.1 MAG: hypothetical protein EOS58_27780 [Mesorhizobium sp.]